MADKPVWSPDKEEALKALIRQTIDAAGTSDPASLPHRVKERLKGRAKIGRASCRERVYSNV